MLFLEPSEIEMVKVLHSKKVPVQVVEMNATKEQVKKKKVKHSHYPTVINLLFSSSPFYFFSFSLFPSSPSLFPSLFPSPSPSP